MVRSLGFHATHWELDRDVHVGREVLPLPASYQGKKTKLLK